MNKKVIAGIVAVVLLGGAFYAGMMYQKSQAPSFTRGAGGGFAGGPGGAGGRGTRGGGAGGFIGGTILSKDAQGITVQMQGGGSKIVFIGASTTVMKATAGTPNDLTVGANVMVVGSPNPDGSVNASSINLREARPQNQ